MNEVFNSALELARYCQARMLDEAASLVIADRRAVKHRVLGALRGRIYARTEPRPELLSEAAAEELIWVLQQIAELEKADG
jgi:hypothetical protein